MSKALRVVTEEGYSLPQLSIVLSRGALCSDLSGAPPPPPCFQEFQSLITCIKEKKRHRECYSEYDKLFRCLRDQGASTARLTRATARNFFFCCEWIMAVR